MGQPGRQGRHHLTPLVGRQGQPAADLGERAAAAFANPGGRVDHADLHTGRLDGGCTHRGFQHGSGKDKPYQQNGNLRALLGRTRDVAGLPADMATGELDRAGSEAGHDAEAEQDTDEAGGRPG